MRIAHIQPMRERHVATTTCFLGALLATGLLSAAPIDDAYASDAGPVVLSGPARVIDGDTISIAGTRIRLEGIDAPEAGQTCKSAANEPWPCGSQATANLSDIVAGKSVVCEKRGTDKYGRILATCFVGGQDINALMVRQGYAWAFVKYSSAYVREEAEARAEKRGIWQGPAVPAWEYRAQRWVSAAPRAPDGCAIKGNISRQGRIYHMPWSPWYHVVKIDEARGEKWFCTEAEALAAGWRPVNAH
jgi:endonuclease YncB( thermonuclease family)